MATIARDTLFNNSIDKSGLYKGWTEEELTKITVPDRAVFYDSNVAFTDGNGSIVDTSTTTHTIPNLYETLEGLNNRINNSSGQVSTADSNLYVTKDSGVLIAPGNGDNNTIASAEENVKISIGTKDGDRINVEATDISFTVGEQTYTLVDVFKMIHELDCRTAVLKTTQERITIDHDMLSNQKYTININKIATSD